MTTIMTAPARSGAPPIRPLTPAQNPILHFNSRQGEPPVTGPIPWSRSMPFRASFARACGVWKPHITLQQSQVRLTDNKPTKGRGTVPRSSSVHALAMLTRQPVNAAPVPRFHIAPRVVDASLLVADRASGEQFQVYTPRFIAQFRAGHRAGLWYVRHTRDLGVAPRSPGYATTRDAVEALHTASWNLSTLAVDLRCGCCRILWS
jgi:hypothetical protein